MGNQFNMHTIKRQARKEAWYGDSWNPFRKTGRAKTWGPSPNDIEAGGNRSRIDHSRDVQDSPLSMVQTEPTFRSKEFNQGYGNDGVLGDGNGHIQGTDHSRHSKENEHEMTPPRDDGFEWEGKTSRQ